MFTTPVLLITFNRPNHVRQVLTEVLKQNPQDLYVCQDGARENNTLDRVKCQEVRDVVNELTSAYAISNKEFRLYTLYQEKNLGCGPGPAAGISWFFENVEMGIILEDDCVPSETLFRFYEELLLKYKDDDAIALITGTNALGKWKSYKGDYIISKFGMTMGAWASWRRAWELFDGELSTWNDSMIQEEFRTFVGNDMYHEFSVMLDDLSKNGANDVWDYQWAFSCLANHKYRLVSTINQMSNIGFCNQSTHTSNPNDRRANMQVYTNKFPIRIVSEKVDVLFDWVMFQRFERRKHKTIFIRCVLKLVDLIFRR